ncbi:hypothetical protein NMY22_g2172 [Coprinellus aureogranulatus]|nr:hypothetical protein NMY22_g2172 [Coprinellus aureogranulatus]
MDAPYELQQIFSFCAFAQSQHPRCHVVQSENGVIVEFGLLQEAFGVVSLQRCGRVSVPLLLVHPLTHSVFPSPACIISFGLTALRRGEFADAWAWSDAPEEDHDDDEQAQRAVEAKSKAKESVIVEGIDSLPSRSTTPKEVKHSGGRR